MLCFSISVIDTVMVMAMWVGKWRGGDCGM